MVCIKHTVHQCASHTGRVHNSIAWARRRRNVTQPNRHSTAAAKHTYSVHHVSLHFVYIYIYMHSLYRALWLCACSDGLPEQCLRKNILIAFSESMRFTRLYAHFSSEKKQKTKKKLEIVYHIKLRHGLQNSQPCLFVYSLLNCIAIYHC